MILTIELFIQFLLFFFILILVWTDERFSSNRKFLFLVLCLFLWVISFYIEKTPFLLIKDLFWYSLILNGSFIFHVLIMNRLFIYCLNKHYDYLSFLISRISFTLSLWSIHYVILLIYSIIHIFSPNKPPRYNWHLDFYVSIYYTKYKYWFYKIYSKYIKNIKIIDKYYVLIYKLLCISQNIILGILLHFSLIFHNYSLFLLGKNKKLSWNDIELKIIMFLLFYCISMWIGIPRLYIIWIFQFGYEMYKIFLEIYEKIDKPTDDWSYYFGLSYINYTLHSSFYIKKSFDLGVQINIKHYIYHKLFMFDIYKFLSNKYEAGGWISGIWDFGNKEYKTYDKKIDFPIRKIYKYYSWKEIAIGYIKIWYWLKINEEANGGYPVQINLDIFWIEEMMRWLYLLNIKEKEECKKYIYEIFITGDPEYLNMLTATQEEILEFIHYLILSYELEEELGYHNQTLSEKLFNN